MNMIYSFNRTMEYFETVLTSEADKKKVVLLSGYSYAMFSRLFSILTNLTLTEYLRFRRLTCAAIDLRETQEKVIDIAVKYGYDSADSFTAAFKRFHRHTPTEVRNGESFEVFSKIQLSLNIRGGREMDIRIQRKQGFQVAGVKREQISSEVCHEVWEELFEKYSEAELQKLGSGQSFGMCYETEDASRINYMACYDVQEIEKAKQMGLEVREIKEAEYAVVTLKGAIPSSIHEGWKYVMEVFFPEQGYRHSAAPDFEVYTEGDMYSSDYRLELWIPVEKIENRHI